MSDAARGVVAGVRLQLAVFRRGLDSMLALITAPLITIAFMAITRHAGRADLTAYAIIAPAVMAVLGMAISTSGEIVTSDRASGTMELAIAAPAPFPAVVFGRIATVTLISLLAVGESWIVAQVLFRASVPVPHPAELVATTVLTVLAMAGTALLMAGTFVAARSARTFQNTISYPLVLLGGAFVPVALLPAVLRPVTRLVFLSWSTDLLRDCLAAGAIRSFGSRLAMVAGLGALNLAIGFVVLHRVIDRGRQTGRMGNQ
jgi:ABC-2 type transport system permease protein